MKKWQWVQTGALQGISLGTVRFNLQQTSEDGKMTLRLFGRSDDPVPATPNREFQTFFVSFQICLERLQPPKLLLVKSLLKNLKNIKMSEIRYYVSPEQSLAHADPGLGPGLALSCFPTTGERVRSSSITLDHGLLELLWRL